jgi:hypothetical protein
MGRDRRADEEEQREAVGRFRFRASFTVAVLQLAVAMAGVGAALVVARWRDGSAKGGQRTTYAVKSAGRSAGHRGTARAPRDPRTPERSSAPPPSIDAGGRSQSAGADGAGWPVGFVGYTVALASDVIRSDAVGALAKASAAGLHRVGVLRSDRYASLTPGYWFVFSGVYATVGEARREVPAAVDAGFSDAYVRRVAE